MKSLAGAVGGVGRHGSRQVVPAGVRALLQASPRHPVRPQLVACQQHKLLPSTLSLSWRHPSGKVAFVRLGDHYHAYISNMQHLLTLTNRLTEVEWPPIEGCYVQGTKARRRMQSSI